MIFIKCSTDFFIFLIRIELSVKHPQDSLIEYLAICMTRLFGGKCNPCMRLVPAVLQGCEGCILTYQVKE